MSKAYMYNLSDSQNLYEAVRSDRNLYSKNLIESQDEITEMKRKLKIMNHQIDQLKEEIMAKEAALVKEHLEHQRVEKEKDALKAELQRMKQQAAESKAYIEQQEVEERKLLKIISEADAERLRQKKELDQVGPVQNKQYVAANTTFGDYGHKHFCLSFSCGKLLNLPFVFFGVLGDQRKRYFRNTVGETKR